MRVEQSYLLTALLVSVAVLLVCHSVGDALTYDFTGPDAQSWFDEFVQNADTTVGGGDAGWQLTAMGLTTDDNIGTAHQRIGIAKDWTDYTLESRYQYIQYGSHKEAHLYVRWQDEGNNYYFRTIGRDNTGATAGYSIEWLRKIGGSDNEGDISDDVAVVGDLQEGTVYGMRGTITGQLLEVEYDNGGGWQAAGEVEYPGDLETGGIGVARSSAQVAWEYLKVNGDGIPLDTTPVEALNKMATTWSKLKAR